MLPFDQSQRVKDLAQLAKSAPDLTDSGFITEKRLARSMIQGAGWKLFWGLQRIDSPIEEQLVELACERDVIARMQQMQEGALINSIEGIESENRPALHTAQRAQKPLRSQVAEKVRLDADVERGRIAHFLSQTDETFSHLLVIGIGGSELGPKALYLGLKAFERAGRHIHFVSSHGAEEIHLAIKGRDLAKILVVSISKSGSTLETQTAEAVLRGIFRERGLQDRDHFVSISTPKSLLDDETRYRERFHLDETIGGRLSTTSAIGAFIIGFMISISAFEQVLLGASEMDQIAKESDVRKNLPLWMALIGIWNRNFLDHHHLAVLPYTPALSRLTAHLQQLDMESNGKQIDRFGNRVAFQTGPLIWGEPGTNAQHSIGQWLHQGRTISPVDFIGCLKPQTERDFFTDQTSGQEKLLCNLFAQSLALAQGKKDPNPNKSFAGNRPSSLLLTQKLTPETIGSLWALYEHKVAFQGFLWNINSFDQEGVQLGKVLATKLIKEIAARRKGAGSTDFLGKCLIDQLEI